MPISPEERRERDRERTRKKRAAMTPEQVEKERARSRAYFHENKDRILSSRRGYQSEYRHKNKERLKTYKRSWDEEHKEARNQQLIEQRRNDPQARLAYQIRGRLGNLPKVRTSKRIENDTGLSIDDLKRYIEGKFQEGMSWDNYGDWEFDHIKPISSFDLTDPNQYSEAAHFTNIQPLWAEDNRIKGSRLCNQQSTSGI